MEDSDFEEEEYTTIYRTRRKHRHQKSSHHSSRRHKSKYSQEHRTSEGIHLSPFIEGPTPPTGRFKSSTKDSFNSRSANINDSKKNNVKNFQREHYLPQRRDRVFLGECSDEEENELSVLKTVRVWKLRRTGRRGFDRFRRCVESIQFAIKLCSRKTSKSLAQEESILFFLDTYTQDNDSNANSGLLFDVTPFRSIGQKNFTKSLRSVLEIHPKNRTDHDLTSMQHLLRSFSKFSNLPQHIQRGLCKQGWYSKFERSKVLVREGNRAEFYYLILSGVAVSRCLDDKLGSENRRRQMAEFQRKGDVIGEKEILTNLERPTTIVCKEDVEVLGIDKQDLIELFKSVGGKECIDYLSSVPDLEDFPLQLLQTYQFSCSIHHYRRGAVIVKDSRESEWIYVVKSGSCQVYKAIRRPSETQKTTKNRQPSKECIFPDINNEAVNHRHIMAEVNGDKKKKTETSAKFSKSRTVLPAISHAKNIITRGPPSPADVSTPRKKKTKTKSSGKQRRGSLEGGNIFYAKLDIVTERESFGLQSMIYEDLPSLSLAQMITSSAVIIDSTLYHAEQVSNGAECILISKQFLRDHMNDEVRRRLLSKIPAYPSLSKLRGAVDDKLVWDSYKDKVIQDVLR